MAVEIVRPGEVRWVKGLIFAPGGHGKTHLLGTAQEDDRTYPMLLLDFEGGEETLAGLDIDVVAIRSWDDYSEVFEHLSSDEHWKIPGTSLKKGETYKSLGIDSISETHIWGLLTRIAEKGPSRREPDLIEMGDYGVVGTQMRRLLREFRDLQMHVFYTAGAKQDEERKVGKIIVPSMSGQLSSEVVHLMSFAGYLAKGEEENEDGEWVTVRELLLNEEGYRVKVRTGWGVEAPDSIENPSMTTLLDALAVPQPKGKQSPKRKEA